VRIAIAALVVAGCSRGAEPREPVASRPPPPPTAQLYVIVAAENAAVRGAVTEVLEDDGRIAVGVDASVAGFEVRAKVEHVVTPGDPGTSVVDCDVDIMVVTHPEGAMYAVVDGGGQALATNGNDDIARAVEDCSVEVARSLAELQVLPALLRKVSSAQ
jgi:hypothetical protein